MSELTNDILRVASDCSDSNKSVSDLLWRCDAEIEKLRVEVKRLERKLIDQKLENWFDHGR